MILIREKRNVIQGVRLQGARAGRDEGEEPERPRGAQILQRDLPGVRGKDEIQWSACHL